MKKYEVNMYELWKSKKAVGLGKFLSFLRYMSRGTLLPLRLRNDIRSDIFPRKKSMKNSEGNMKRYEKNMKQYNMENIKKYEGNMEKYEGNTKKYGEV